METLIESTSQTKPDKNLQQSNEHPISRKNIITMFIVCMVIILSIVCFTYTTYFIEGRRLNDVVNQLENTKSKLATIESKNQSDLSKLETINRELNFVNFEHGIEGGIVTDDFVVNKATFNTLDSSKLSAIIDIDTQPGMSPNYKGKGSFSISDRELKSKIEDIVKQVADSYASYFQNADVVKWDSGTFDITIKNYDIGTYSNGHFKLKGE